MKLIQTEIIKKQPRTILTDDFRGSVSINEEEKKVLLDVIKVKLF